MCDAHRFSPLFKSQGFTAIKSMKSGIIFDECNGNYCVPSITFRVMTFSNVSNFSRCLGILKRFSNFQINSVKFSDTIPDSFLNVKA